MAKFRICPHCGHRNSPNKIQCEICEEDLISVRVTEETAEKSAPPVPAPEPEARRIRICENCGMHHRPNERKCSQCGEDISDILPVAENGPGSQEPTPVMLLPRRYMLASLQGDLLYEIPEGETVLGREAALSDYLRERLYVGRKQARLCLEDDRLSIGNLRATNETFVNNRRLGDQMTELCEGDEIGLGGNSVSGKRQDLAAYFRVVRK
ncbi:MAG: FHA domain-containing protein [Clostridia bacterium]|nr:FHA domain-containing protein [Clostridia bacterium]